ncbi:TIR domain-containing protein [Rhodococcus sp. IEGM 1401]|uniref:TIR domain-containing protein n=1 Tax=unclassified Rhodococcus (in: high G+C Gram-positive bacteria) TaxID=192944 RepID=UPI0022B3F3AF|nr:MULTISPECIES: TIR domain-containing protein [unclassified Rhodococcus (in: high G+C Gram-positive bacteria)]MCZ4562272.1 TIR domain-containing protein [Rhodococcus sp. IEGM 1401]MDI9922315.1 TIR domain-containing protein [Rhodococcus sp. IEGM 1372]MDI9926745.1 TIR domain-containing protein [Rhodococcus sp. IEGM 1341]MDV8034866.1 TIR domain-containing protein [Rhodococcus sp. IEGM 1414]
MGHYQQRQLEAFAARVAARKEDPTRHKCFVSYHAADIDEVTEFINEFGTEFIAKTVGVTDEDDFIDSNDSDYVMDRIRTKYLGDSTVTIALMGKCTWARRYIDWEVYSSLRSSKLSKVNGLLAIRLPSGGDLQARIKDNIERTKSGVDIGYARWETYPTSKSSLRTSISDAFTARTTRNLLINNSRSRRLSSAPCT